MIPINQIPNKIFKRNMSFCESILKCYSELSLLMLKEIWILKV